MSEGGRSKGARASVTRFALRVAVSALILVVIAQFIPAGEVLSRMASVSPLLWGAVFAIYLAGHALSAQKWRMMIGGDISYRRALKAHFAGLAANLALPGVAGGDIVRAGIVMKGSDRKTALAVGSLAERLVDTGALFVVAAIGGLWLGARAGVNPAALTVLALAVCAAGVAAVAFAAPAARLVAAKAPSGKAGALIGKIAGAIEETAARRRAFAICAALSVGIQAAFALCNGALAADLGSDASLAAWLFAWPLAKLVATLPISFGGLGVREASLVGFLSPLGYQSAGVVAAGLVWQSIQFAGAAVGALAQGLGGAKGGQSREALNG